MSPVNQLIIMKMTVNWSTRLVIERQRITDKLKKFLLENKGLMQLAIVLAVSIQSTKRWRPQFQITHIKIKSRCNVKCFILIWQKFTLSANFIYHSASFGFWAQTWQSLTKQWLSNNAISNKNLCFYHIQQCLIVALYLH